jgi:hypothetical protein
MKPLIWLTFASVVLAASGCASGGARTAAPAAAPIQPEGTGARLIPFSLPFRTDAAVQAATSAARNTQNSVGQIPTISVPVTVGLVDAPLFGLAQVNLGLERINAIANLGTAKQVEVPLEIFPGDAIVNVLDYQSFAAIIAAAAIPAGSYDALELVCDPSDSTVVTTAGATLPIVYGNFSGGAFTPSTSGHYSIVVPYDFNAAIGVNDELIDFNVENSVAVQSTSADVSASTFAVSANAAGAIGGTLVTPAGAPVQNATAIVTNASGTVVGLAPTDASGNFVVHAIAAGTYTLTIQESYVTHAGVTVSASDGKTGSLAPLSVNVPAGFEAYVGTIKD